MDNLDYVLAGYAAVALGLGGYFAHLLFRARRAKDRVVTAATRRPS